MTWGGKLVTLFPILTGALALAAVGWLARSPAPAPLLLLIFVIYLFPPLTFRLHNLCFPLRAGATRFSAARYSPWWASHQFQLIYIAFPALEAALRLIPGAYSAWLRLWGSQIGRGVYWTPRVEILDRSLMQVGNGVVFGHRVACVAHVIDSTTDGSQILLVRPVRIGHHALLGAGSSIGPGCQIAEGARLDALSVLRVNATYPGRPAGSPSRRADQTEGSSRFT